jgi:tRNA (guanine9-N1)-methyltransferase
MTDIESSEVADLGKGEVLSQLQDQPLSKNARKRLEKAQRMAESKQARRAREKARKQEKKRVLRERTSTEGDMEGPLPKKLKISHNPPIPFDATVVIDLGFDNLMTPKVK